MVFDPDIVISVRDGTDLLLVAETKSGRTSPDALGAAENQLRQYMIAMRCGLGMLVTPKTLRIFRDSYRGYTPDSIELVGDFPFPAGAQEEGETNQRSGVKFETLVQRWLEGLRDQSTRKKLASPLREAIEEHIVPVLRVGEIRAAHARRLASRASDSG